MTNRVQLKSIAELNAVATSVYNELIKNTASIAKLLKYQVTLLELLSIQTKKLDRVGYCDYEFAYICYSVALMLYGHTERDVAEEFQKSIKVALVKKKDQFDTVKHFLGQSDQDPLVQRFQRLESAASTSSTTSTTSTTSTNSGSSPVQVPVQLEDFKFRDFISAPQLHYLLNSQTYGNKILLIDFRESKDYNHNHIKYKEIIHIPPSVLHSLIGTTAATTTTTTTNLDNITDQDLENRLKLHLPHEEYLRFQSRYKYDLIVIYNLNYGHLFIDRLDNLKALVTSDKPLNNPFSELIEMLMFKNKYISSHLKAYPIILAGGVYNWHAVYGDQWLERSHVTHVLTRPEASLSRGSSTTTNSQPSSRRGSYQEDSNVSRTASPYLRNFGDYLSTAKSTSNTPISNSFSPKSPQVVSTNHNQPLPLPPIDAPIATSPPLQQAPPPKLTRANSSTVTITKTKSKEVKDVKQVKEVNGQFLEQYATGLVNLGNSCYMNCILQCLGATPQLTGFFFPNLNGSGLNNYRQHINVNNRLGTKGILTNNFVGLLADMFRSNGSSFCPTNFKKVAGSLSPGQQFATFDQQDCIEFLNFILDGLHEDLNQMVIVNAEDKKAVSELTPEQEKTREQLPIRLASTIEWERYLKLNFSIVVDYFQGQHLSQLKCLECGMTSTTYNSFSILSLPIPEKLGTMNVSLDDCLKEFVTTELLDDNNKWHCPRCKRFTKSTKKISITRLPQVLIIHFKRFKVSPTGYFNKLDTFINYPVKETLDLTSYWPEVGTYLDGTNKDSLTREKEEQILSSLPTRNQTPPFRYKLYGVANHFGNLTTGHYTSYVYKKSDNKKLKGWCYFDDSKITYNCRDSQVMNKNAYCLFYQRV